MLPREDFYSHLVQDTKYSGEYWERLDDTMPYPAVGWAGPIFLFNYLQNNEGLTGIGKRSLVDQSTFMNQNRSSYRIAGVIGVNLRIVDDVLDGDGCEAVADRERFLENYIEAIQTGDTSNPAAVEEEAIAYTAGGILHDTLYDDDEAARENAVEILQRMKPLVIDEDKSEKESYLEYAEAAGRECGKLLMTSFGILDDVSPTTEDTQFAGDYGFAVQVADDKFDDDIGLDDRVLDEIYYRSFSDLNNHDGMVPTLISHTGMKAPATYSWLMKINDRLFAD